MFTLFAVGYSPNKPTVSSVPNRFRKSKIGLSYLWLVLHRQKRYTLPSSALNGSFRLSDACVNRETQKASYSFFASAESLPCQVLRVLAHSTAVSFVATSGDGAILEPSKKGITKDNTLIQEYRLTIFS